MIDLSLDHRTGLPKGVVLTHRMMVSASFSTIGATMRSVLRRGEGIPGPDPTQLSYLLGIPLFHVTGCCNISLPIVVVGGKIVLMRKWDSKQGANVLVVYTLHESGC
jgi:long-chain acyl-CoA synthetase